MGGLINDLSMWLDDQQQTVLTQWGVKTAMVIEGVMPTTDGFYSPEQRNAFRTTLIPETDTGVWLGRCAERSNLHGEARKLHVSGTRTTNPVEDGCVTTLVAGRLVMQVLSVRRKSDAPAGSLSLKIRPGLWESQLIQIWPIGKRLNWPPPKSFSDLDDGLLDLKGRFAIGVQST
jgi:hypothetical protein